MAKTAMMTVKLSLDVQQFTKGIEQARSKIRTFGKDAVSAGKSLSFGVTLPIVGLSAAMIKLSSDATETNNKFNEIFGKSAKKTGQALDKLADTVGRDSVKLKEFAGDIGGVSTAMGFTDKEAGDLSKSLIKLGIDVGSFRNKSDDQVIKAFTSALTGERESLKSLGVALLDADVNQEAFRMTGKKNVKDLTKQEKALATVSLLYKSFGKDVGDAERTQKEFANQLKVLDANVRSVGRAFGDELKPLANEFLLIINPMIKNFANLNKETKRTILIVAGLVGAIGPLLLSVGLLSQAVAFGLGGYVSMAKGMGKVISTASILANLMKTGTVATTTQTAAQTLLGNSYDSTTIKVVKQSRVVSAYTKVSSMATTSIASMSASLKSLTFANVISGLNNTSAAAGGLIKKMLIMSVPIAAVVVALALVVNAGLTVARHWEQLKYEAGEIWTSITTSFSEGVKEIKKWVVDKTKPIIDFFIDGWDTLAGVVSDAWGSISASIGKSVGKIVGWIKDKVVVALNLLISGYNNVVSVFGGTPLTPFADFDGVVNVATDAYKSVKKKTSEFAGDVTQAVKDIGAAVKESAPFETFVDETKKNMELAQKIFDNTVGKMAGFSFSMGGSEDPKKPAATGGGGGDEAGFFENLKSAAVSAYDAIKLKMDEMKAKQAAMVAANQATINSFTEGWLGFSANFQGIVGTMQAVTSSMFQQFADGVSMAFASAIMEGQNLMEQMKDLAMSIGKSIIQMLIKIGIERAAQALIGAAVSKTTGAATIKTSVATAYSGGLASMAAAPWPLNMSAPFFASSMAGLAAGGFAMLAKGGVTTGPTLAMIGEGAENEAVLPLSKLDAMVNGGRNGNQTIILELDGRQLTEMLIPHQPSVVRFRTGVSY